MKFYSDKVPNEHDWLKISEPIRALFAGKGRESPSNATLIVKTQLTQGCLPFLCSSAVLMLDSRFASTRVPFISIWTERCPPGQSGSCTLKVELLPLLFLRSRSPIVCEHLVYKCLEYLIFVNKKAEKSTWLDWVITKLACGGGGGTTLEADNG